MTTQFNKFLIGLLSLGCGLATFFGLLYFGIPKNDELVSIVYLLFYLGVAVGSIFVYYAVFSRALSRFLYTDIPVQDSSGQNILWANKFGVLVVIITLVVWISGGVWTFVGSGLILVFAVLSFFKDKRIGKIIILSIIVLAALFQGWQYVKYKQETRVVSLDSIQMTLPKGWSWLSESVDFVEHGFLIWDKSGSDNNYHLNLTFTKKESNNPILEFGFGSIFAGNLDNGKAYYYSRINSDKNLVYGLGVKNSGGDVLYDVEFKFRKSYSSDDINKAEGIIKSIKVLSE